MKVARYLLHNTHSHKRRLYKKSKSDIFSAYWSIKFIFKMIIYLISAIIGIAIFSGNFIYKTIKRIKGYRHYKEIGLNSLRLRQDIERMQPRQFEIFCCELLKANGYNGKVTQSTCDGGKDIICTKNCEKIFVEVKHWRSECGRVLLQKLIGACIGEKADKAIFITTSWFNSNAREYAEKIDWLELWDMNDLLNVLYNTNANKIPWIMSKAMEYHEEDILDKINNFGSKIDKYSNDLDRQY